MSFRDLQLWKGFAVEAAKLSSTIVKCLCASHVISTYLFCVARSYGPSMLPTLNIDGDIVIADMISPRIGNVRAGDLVLVRSPRVPRTIVTKRVIGLEGDSVTYVVDPNNSDETNTVVVPKGHIWIQGDNIYNSKDSRDFGAVPYGLLYGRIFWRVWPPKNFGPLGQR